jgi:hypothetical protein
MSINYGDILKHNNPIFPIVDVEDVKGGTRTIGTFNNTDLYNAFNGIPDKLKQNYSNIIVTSTNQHYYLSGTDATITTSWTLIGSGLSTLGTTNSITKWTGSTSLGDSLITDNGDTITINGNLTVIGTSSTITSENLLVKDPIILLAGSQSTPLFDSGLFVNRGSGDTQAFIWDESSSEFSFFSTTSSATTSGNVLIGTYSNVRTGALSVGTGVTSSRFSVSSTGGTLSLVVNEQGDTIFSGDTKISGKTFSNLPPGSITFGSKTAIYSPANNTIVIGTSFLDPYVYNYGWKFNNYQIENLDGNAIEVQNTIGTIGNLWVGSNYTFAGYGVIPSQQSTLFVKGTTSSIMKVVGIGATWSNSQSIFEINNNGAVSIGTSGASASLHIKGTSSVSGNSLLVENNSNTQLLKVVNNGQIILGDGVAGPGGAQGVFIVGQGNANYGLNSSNPNLLTFIVGSTDASFISGIQGASLNHGNVRSGIYFTNNASDIVFRTGYVDQYGTQTAQLQERMRIGVSGNVNINSATAMSGSKLFIQSNTASTTIGSNVMLDLYNGQLSAPGSQVSEIAFSADSAGNDPYNTQHRYAVISGYATTWNNVTTGGGIKFSTRALTTTSLVTSLVLDPNGGVYNQSRGISNTIYGYQTLLVGTSSINNVAIGYQALYSTTTGNENVAIGYKSLYFNTTGYYNTGVGNYSLYGNKLGSQNIAIGLTTLYNNNNGSSNISIGNSSLYNNTDGSENIVIGNSSQLNATQSNYNISIGNSSLYNNIADSNIAIGYQSLYSNTSGSFNTAIGFLSLYNNTTAVDTISILSGGSGYTASSTFSSIQLNYISGSTALTYPIVTIHTDLTGVVDSVTLETKGTGFKNTTTIMGANLGTGVTFSISINYLLSGNNNTAVGYQSMYHNYTGYESVSIGVNSLLSNTTGYQNTAIGFSSMGLNTTGYHNTAVGYKTLQSNKTGWGNVVVGHSSLSSATQSSYNTVVGYNSLPNNSSGQQNTAIGFGSLQNNTTGTSNSTLGMYTLLYNTTGSNNISIGQNCLLFNTTGSTNIAIGSSAGTFDILSNGVTSSNTSIFIGDNTKSQSVNQSNQIVIGYGATGSGSNSVTLGASTITKTQLRGTINIGNVLQYASNGAAISGGLVPGDIYQTLSNVLMVVV